MRLIVSFYRLSRIWLVAAGPTHDGLNLPMIIKCYLLFYILFYFIKKCDLRFFKINNNSSFKIIICLHIAVIIAFLTDYFINFSEEEQRQMDFINLRLIYDVLWEDCRGSAWKLIFGNILEFDFISVPFWF